MSSRTSAASRARARLFVAASFDARAMIGVIVVEFRGASPRFSVTTVRSAPTIRAQFDEALRVASSRGLTSFDIFAPERNRLDRSVLPPPGVRFRWVQKRKNSIARGEARRQLLQLRQLNRLRSPRPDAEPEYPPELPEELDPLML